MSSAALAFAHLACTSVPEGRTAVDAVDVEGTDDVRESAVLDKLATTPTPKFLGLFRGIIYDYSLFNRYVLQRDLQRIERYYRARGFYKARARAARIFREGKDRVRVVIRVEEGPPVVVRQVVIRGLDRLPRNLRAAALEAAQTEIAEGDRFEEEHFAEAEEALERALTDRGYAYASVERKARVDVPNDFAILAFDVDPDTPAVFGDVQIEGLGPIPEAPVRRAIDIAKGDPYSTSALRDAEQALLDLGVFTSVSIEPDLVEPRATPRVIPLRARVVPNALRTVRLGGGVRLDTIRTEAHLIAGWEHRNFLGGLRFFSAEIQPGVVLYPTRIPTLSAPTNYLPEARLRLELRQPGFIEARTNGFVRTEASAYAVLLDDEVDEAAPVLGYREAKLSVGIDRSFGRRLYVRPSHNVQANMPFAYVGELDPALSGILWISYPELFASLDFRDDRVKPHSGAYFSATLQAAGAGGDARDVRVQPEARAYLPLADRLTFAVRATTGLLFPFNYERPAPSVDREAWADNAQILFFRGFFSGGPTSNRGYPERGVGPHGPIPFYLPGRSAEQIGALCDGADDSPSCSMPLGGFTLWEASAEVRIDFDSPLSVAAFCDASDVAPSTMEYRFDRPHLSCGPGLRYDTPVGPIRADIGIRLPGLQVLSEDTSGEGDPGEIFGLPVAVSIGIGEAF